MSILYMLYIYIYIYIYIHITHTYLPNIWRGDTPTIPAAGDVTTPLPPTSGQCAPTQPRVMGSTSLPLRQRAQSYEPPFLETRVPSPPPSPSPWPGTAASPKKTRRRRPPTTTQKIIPNLCSHARVRARDRGTRARVDEALLLVA